VIRADQRAIAFRLLAWIAILTWATWKMSPDVRKPQGRWALLPPRDHAAAATPLQDVVDLEAAIRTMDAVAARAAMCPASGVLRVELGPDGLQDALLVGEGDIACVGEIAWGGAWPRTRQAFTMEQDF
jgi:hypothetical protein